MTVGRRHLNALVRRALVSAVLLGAVLGTAPAAATPLLQGVDPLDELEILAVRDGEPAEVLFAAPARMMMQTLTSADVVATVDGTEQPLQLQRLAATDLEVAVVADTTLPQADVRRMQGAIVELALDLPQGATMRLIDAEGVATETAAVPGPAISQVKGLRFDTADDLQRAVERATEALDVSPQDRTALLVMGRDLGRRIQPIDGQPLTRVNYIVNVAGSGQDDGLLGPGAAGTVIAVEDIADVLPATDDMSQDLRNLYRAEVEVPDPDARSLTLALPDAGEDAPSSTVALDPDSIRPGEVDAVPDGADAPDTGDEPAAPGAADAPADPGVTLRDVLARAAVVGGALIVLALLWLLVRRSRRAEPRRSAISQPDGESTRARTRAPTPTPASEHEDEDEDELGDRAPTARSDDVGRMEATPTDGPRWGGTEHDEGGTEAAAAAAPDAAPKRPRRTPVASGPRTRPIAKLSTSTREALAHAHLGLRRLALASREAADSVPDDLFRLTEASASVALSGPRIDIDALLVARLTDDEPLGGAGLVLRTATALSTGWQHTARRKSAPPPVIEINAVLSGRSPTGAGAGPQRPVAPVRALNPLVEIGLEHIVLAGRPGADSDLVARAVTAVDVMRAARLARPALAMSPWLLADRRRYRSCLDADLNDPQQRDEWLEFLCSGIARGATESAERLRRLDRLRTRYRERSADMRVLPLIDLLMSHPVVDAGLVTRRLSTSSDTAELLLSTVFQSGWLQPHPRLPDTWVADQVVSLFTDGAGTREPTSQPA